MDFHGSDFITYSEYEQYDFISEINASLIM